MKSLFSKSILFIGILLALCILTSSPVSSAAPANMRVYVEPDDTVATVCVDGHCQVTCLLPDGQGPSSPDFQGTPPMR